MDEIGIEADEKWKLSLKQSRLFKTRVKYWQGKFGLFDWRINVEKGDLGRDTPGAGVFIELEARVADIVLNNVWNLKPTGALLNQAAFHEVCEILVEELRSMVKRKKFSEEQLVGAVHTLIRRLEHVCLGVD